MTTIEGTTGKAQALFDFLEKLQVEATLFESDHQDRKKRKLDHDQSVSDKPLFNYTIELPLTLHNVDRELVEQLASAFSNNFDQKLVSEWSYMTLEDTIFASMKIVSDHTLLAENECMLMSNQFKQANTEIIEGQTQLLVAIIYAASMQFIEATDIQIRGSNTKLSVFVRFVQKKKNTNKLIRALSDHVHIEQLTRIEKACTSKTLPALVSPPSTAPASLPPPPSYPSFVPVPNNTSIDAFYQYLQPPVSNTRLKPYLSPRISAQLTPFQSQNVEWMMLREGHYADTKGDVYPNHNILDGLPLLYANDQKGNYLNVFNHQTVTERSDIMDLIQQSFRGGILADEMGLGKTIR
ncbi:uncharacterized protein B0P05DRAFT_89668 [Gilbertella persicaria]|uniref:uncharacterized protein n=1 Tax=Gilbertella persicaria TaxID=101096 RepID=UPI0022208CDC|nr:uncharacterized protein B0P05DRAFT_89668 [Gilbertella persicaria]KAI8079653.1 hypothetical protein B0P05DRAFT_89668 [Gilbertella persicaria]